MYKISFIAYHAVKKAAAVAFKATIQYSTTINIVTWKSRIGTSAAIWAIQKAAGL